MALSRSAVQWRTGVLGALLTQEVLDQKRISFTLLTQRQSSSATISSWSQIFGERSTPSLPGRGRRNGCG